MAQTPYTGTVYLRILFCFLLFVAPFVEFLIPGGDVYLAGAAGIVALAGIAFGRTRRQRTLFLSRVDVLFVICWIYVAFNMPLPLDGGMGIELIAMGAIWGYARLHDTPQFRRAVGRWMIMVGLGQAAVGLLQGCGFLDSFHSEFAVTGTFGNPGPWGGYLAVVAAFLLPYAMQEGLTPVKRGALLGGMVMITVAMVWSDSRAAWCSLGVAVFLFFYLKYPVRKRMFKIVGSALLAAVVTVAVTVLYGYRPASADARILIWQVVGKIVSQAPLTGVGTGRFAAHYMPAQAEYLVTATDEERHIAGDNTLAYNETLTVLCEQGVVGLCLGGTLMVFVMRGLRLLFRLDGSSVFFFPFVSWLVFSQFSYPLNVWSLACLFPLMVAMGSGQKSVVRLRETHWSRFCCLRLFCRVLLGVGSVLLMVYCAGRWKAQVWIHDYSVFASSSDWPGVTVDCFIRHDPFLLACCADAAFLRADFCMALSYMEQLSQYVQLSQLNFRQGICYEEIGDTLNALDSYNRASRMMPSLMSPVFAEFNLYRAENKRDKALFLAREIVDFRPKVENRKTRAMRQEAHHYLQHASD